MHVNDNRMYNKMRIENLAKELEPNFYFDSGKELTISVLKIAAKAECGECYRGNRATHPHPNRTSEYWHDDGIHCHAENIHLLIKRIRNDNN